MTEHKRYKISKISDILDVPEDRLDAMFSDMREWYRHAKQMKTVDSENVSISKTFTWIDDGIVGVSHASVVLPNGTTIDVGVGKEIDVANAFALLIDSIVGAGKK